MKNKLTFVLAFLFIVFCFNTNIQASTSKEINYCVETGRTITIKDIKKSVKLSDNLLKVTKISSKGLQLKARNKEGVETFKYNGKVYNIVVLNKIDSLKYDKVKVKKLNNVYMVVRYYNNNSIVTFLNTNKKNVDIYYMRDEYKSKNEFFEMRSQEIRGLGYNETYSLFSYICMPIHKDSFRVTDSSYISTNAKVKIVSFDKDKTILDVTTTDTRSVRVDSILLKLDKNNKITSTGAVVGHIINPESDKTDYVDNNYGNSDIKKVIVVDSHAHTEGK